MKNISWGGLLKAASTVYAGIKETSFFKIKQESIIIGMINVASHVGLTQANKLCTDKKLLLKGCEDNDDTFLAAIAIVLV